MQYAQLALYIFDTIVHIMDLMQGKLQLQLRTLCVHIEISYLWAEFVNNYRYIIVRLVSEGVKSIFCERWIPCQASTSVMCLHYRPETVTAVQKMRTPLK